MSLKQFGLPFGTTAPLTSYRKPPAWACVYCAAPATTRDHVPPKALLEEPWPLNFRTVPACTTCNVSWSLDEQYFAIALAQVGHVPHLMAKVEPGGVVDRALQAAPRLDDHIVNALTPGEDGRVWFAADLARIGRVATKIAYGLYCLRYGPGAPLEAFATRWISGPEEELPQPIVAAMWNWPGIRRKRWTVVQKGVFSFLFAKGWMVTDPKLYCIINFHDTILAAVTCPAPVGRRRKDRLRARPW